MDGHQYIQQQLIHTEIVKFMASTIENPNAPMPDGWTPIHLAAAEGHLDIVKLLASKVEHPNIPLPDGRTPLFLSVRHGHKDDHVYVRLLKMTDPVILDNIRPLKNKQF